MVAVAQPSAMVTPALVATTANSLSLPSLSSWMVVHQASPLVQPVVPRGKTCAEPGMAPGEPVDGSQLLPDAPKTEQKQSTSWLGKLRLARPSEPELSFEDLLAQDAALRAQGKGQPIQMAEPALLRHPIDPLAETAEDTELRRKLAAGRSGRIA